MSPVDIIDGWEIRPRADGGFGVYDTHGLIAGPFGRKEEAMTAALRLPRPLPQSLRPVPQRHSGAPAWSSLPRT